MSECVGCRDLITRDSVYLNTLASLEQLILLLDPSLNGVNLNSSCLTCLRSMTHDTETELSAIKSRAQQAQAHRQFLVVTGDEYEMVKARFESSGVPGRVFRIEKNINKPLQEECSMACTSSESKLLFHGSQNKNYMNILTEGFKISYSRNGSLGYGVYFADSASYSHSYTGTLSLETGLETGLETRSVRNILLCRVYFDKDTGHGSGIHCVRNDRHCYPEYIIYYETH